MTGIDTTGSNCDINITYHVVTLSVNGCYLGDRNPQNEVSPEPKMSNECQSSGTVGM